MYIDKWNCLVEEKSVYDKDSQTNGTLRLTLFTILTELTTIVKHLLNLDREKNENYILYQSLSTRATLHSLENLALDI